LCKESRDFIFSLIALRERTGGKRVRALAGSRDAECRLGIVLAFAFGCVFIAVVLALAFKGGSLDDRQLEILHKVLALAGGGSSRGC